VLYGIIGFLIGVILTGATCLLDEPAIKEIGVKSDYSRKDKIQ
jgi:hypothetical protein